LDLKHVSDLWDDRTAARLSPRERLVYRSNLLGSDLRIVNTGGGNTSSKLMEDEVEVLWVKGSGGDLRTSTIESFASLYLDKLRSLKDVYAAEAEDRMPGLYPGCAFNGNARTPSIDTPLHAFAPARHVDHTHPNAVIAVAASRRSRELTAEIYGEEVAWIPWLRPGFELGLRIERIRNQRGAVLAQHGLIDWADDDKECYKLTLRLIEQASEYIESKDKGDRTFGGLLYEQLTPAQREEALLELPVPPTATVQSDGPILHFVNSRDALRLAELGTSCPDHFLRTKIKPLFVDWNPRRQDLGALKKQYSSGLDQYRKDYAAYYQACKRADSPPMRNPDPAVILIPGIGMIAASPLAAEFYTCAVEVMRGAEAIDEYIALPRQEAFDIEYWLLEEAKLKRRPNQPESLARATP
jgi:rhamnulose-1-phosphate aldolase/alcohol dehydrogenase